MANDLRLQVLLQALDKSSAPLRRIGLGGKEAADGLRKTRDQLRQLNQAQQQISGFRKLKNDAEASGIAMRAAQQRAAQLRQEMAATDAPTRKAAAAYNRAEREVTKLKNAHLANLTAVREQRAALSAAGVSANGLGSAERRLGMEVSFATAKLHRQTEALRAQGIQQQRLAALERARQANLTSRGMIGGKLMGAVGGAAIGGYALSRVLGGGFQFGQNLQDAANTANMGAAQKAALRRSVIDNSKLTHQSIESMLAGESSLIAAGLDDDVAKRSGLALGRATTATRAQMDDIAKSAFTMVKIFEVVPERLENSFDILSQAGKRGSFELKAMAGVIPTLGASFSSLGLKGNEGLATMGAALQVAKLGAGSDDQAANNLQNFMTKVLSPQSLKNAQEKFGVDLYGIIKKAQKQGSNPFEAAIEAIHGAVGNDQKKLGELFQDMQVQGFLKPIMQHWSEYKDIKKDALSATGTIDRDFQMNVNTATQRIDDMKNAAGRAREAFSKALEPSIEKTSSALSPLLDRVALFIEKNPKLVAGITGLTIGLVGLRIATLGVRYAWTFMGGGLFSAITRFGPAAAGLQGLAVALSAVTLPVWGLVAALAVVVGYLAWKYWGPITAWSTGFGEGLRDVVSPAVKELTNQLAPLKSALDGVLTPFKATNDQLDQFNNGGAFAGIFVGGAFNAAIAPLKNMLAILDAIVLNMEKIKQLTPGGAARETFGRGGTMGSHALGGVKLGAMMTNPAAAMAFSALNDMRRPSVPMAWDRGDAKGPPAPAGFYKPLQAGGVQKVTHNHYPIQVTAAPGREVDAAKAVSAELDRRDRAKAAAARSRLGDTE